MLFLMRRLACLVLLPAWLALSQAPAPEQLFREAVAAQQRGDDALAIRKYRELLKLQPNVPEVRANLGAVLARSGQFDEAIEQYRAALTGNQGNAALRLNLALAYYKKGDLAAAVKDLETVRRAEPGNARAALLLADCYFRLGRDAQVIEVLTPLEKAQPDEPTISWLLGSSLIRSGRPQSGLERVEKAARSRSNAEAYLLAAQTALKLNEFERARDHANAAMRINSQLPGLLTLRGTALQYIGDNQGAIADLRKAVEANANDFDAHLTLGAVLFTERELEGAARHLTRALELNKDSTAALYQMARLQRTQGDLEGARTKLERVVRENPDWPQPHVELSAVYFRLNRPEDGQRERAIFDRLESAQQERERAAQRQRE
jgi:tetratricopeptide (TPR) repeat protein